MPNNLSDDQKKHIESLLLELSKKHPEIISAVAIDFEGTLIASSSKAETEEMAALAKVGYELFSKCEGAVKELDHNSLEQIIATTGEEFTLSITNFGAGIFVCLNSPAE